MSRVTSTAMTIPERWAVEDYLALVARGVLGPEDRVELLEGVIVAMSPHNPRHAAACGRADQAIRAAIGTRAVVRAQLPLVVGTHSVPEPDLAVVPGRLSDYDHAHPTSALLVVEIADSSLMQDRLTKAATYAAAGIPEYWIVNLIDDCVEVHRSPQREARRYASIATVRRGETIELESLPGGRVAVDDLLPSRVPAT
ncbi:MAG: Uma2 family endonuclease [Candidatus Binatia bacterium]